MQHLPENLQAIDVSQRSSINKIVTWERPLLAANRIWPNRRRAGRFVRGVDQGIEVQGDHSYNFGAQAGAPSRSSPVNRRDRRKVAGALGRPV